MHSQLLHITVLVAFQFMLCETSLVSRKIKKMWIDATLAFQFQGHLQVKIKEKGKK